MPTVPLTTVLQNHQVFLPDPVQPRALVGVNYSKRTVLNGTENVKKN
jgi:hypothetical protein